MLSFVTSRGNAVRISLRSAKRLPRLPQVRLINRGIFEDYFDDSRRAQGNGEKDIQMLRNSLEEAAVLEVSNRRNAPDVEDSQVELEVEKERKARPPFFELLNLKNVEDRSQLSSNITRNVKKKKGQREYRKKQRQETLPFSRFALEASRRYEEGEHSNLSEKLREAFLQLGRSPSRTVLVANLPFPVEISEIEMALAPFSVENIRLREAVVDNGIGYCFLDFETADSAADAILQHHAADFLVRDRRLTLHPAGPPIEDPEIGHHGPVRGLYLTFFSKELPHPMSVATRLLPKDLQARTSCSWRVDREGGHSFGHLNFRCPEDAMRARVIIDRHFEENPEWGVLTNYKLSKRAIPESVTQSDN